MRLNLGAGRDPSPGWVNVDMVPGPGIDVVHNLTDYPWPFEDGTATHIKAVDVLEHLPPYTPDHRPGVVAFLEECHRLLVDGGELFIQTPRWDADFLWIDPTHVRGFHEQSLDFFDPSTHYGRVSGYYSRARFAVRHETLPNRNLRFWATRLPAAEA